MNANVTFLAGECAGCKFGVSPNAPDPEPIAPAEGAGLVAASHLGSGPEEVR